MAVIKRLAGYLGPYWKTLIATCALLVLNIAFSLLPPLFQRQIIDQVIGHQALGGLLVLIGGLIAVYALAGLTELGDQYLRHTLGERFICDLRVRLYGHLQRLSLSYFGHTSTGELMSRVTNDVNALEQFVTHGVVLTAIDGLRLLGSAVVLLVLDWRLAVVAFLPIPVVAYGLHR
jgi:ABC-type multidrug transport system fused ATPase/permease subunit